MRLIDADALIKFEEKAWDGSPSAVYNIILIILDDIRDAKTIDAIPVEWMEKWFRKALRWANDGDDVTVDVMLDAWRRSINE